MFSKTFFVRLKHATDISILYGDEILKPLTIPDCAGKKVETLPLRPQDINSVEDYEQIKDLYQEWRKSLNSSLKPTLSHYSLVDIQSLFDSVTVVTTECSGMGKVAGIGNLVELNRNIVDYERPRWFDEPVDPATYKQASEAAAVCEVFIILGYTKMDEMASKLPFIAKGNGCYLVEVSSVETEFTRHCNESLREDLEDFLPKLAILMKKVFK